MHRQWRERTSSLQIWREGWERVQIGQLGNAVSELSQMLSQAIVVPFRQQRAVRPARVAAPGIDGARALGLRGKGQLLLGAGTLSDEQVVSLIHHVGGRHARVVVLPVAAYAFPQAGERYRRPLERYGMDRLDTCPVSTRAQADDPDLVARVAGADLIVLAGGDSGLMLDTLAGTGVEAAVVSVLARGATVCALAAAAEACGERVLVRSPHPDAGTRLGPGLNLLPGTAVLAGQSVAGNLASVFATALSGSVRLVVLDDRATLLVRSGWQAEVRAGTVLVVERPTAANGGDQPALGEVVTRVAPAGWRLDLSAGVVLPPGAAAGASQP